jgi:hypothetical protein
MKVAIVDTDHGYASLMTAVKSLKKSQHVDIGVTDKPHPSGKPSDEIAKYHEYGLGVPQRSFLRGWVADDAFSIELKLQKAAELAVTGKMTLRQGLADIGRWGVDRIKTRIIAFIPPKNAPSTLKHKTGDIPLIDTANMLQAIKYEVNKKR